MDVTLAQQINEVTGELIRRKTAFPNLVRDGRMSAVSAARHIRNMEAVLATLEKLRDGGAT
jgi:hypothetical protein